MVVSLSSVATDSLVDSGMSVGSGTRILFEATFSYSFFVPRAVLFLMRLFLLTGALAFSKTFTVKLAAPPGKSRTVNLAFSKSNPDVSFSPNALIFTSGNWNAAQTVTVSAAEDDDEKDESAEIRLSGDGLQSDSVEINVIDDDGNGDELRFVLTPSELTLTEQGRSETFKVRLNLPPGTDRTVNLRSSKNSDVRFVSTTSLTFTDFNWMKDQTVTIKAIGDSDTADEQATVEVASTGIPMGQVTVRVTDDDGNSPNFIVSIVSPEMLTIDEGSSGTFDVKLSDPPGYNRVVTVEVKCENNSDIGLSHPPLIMKFTNQNWDKTQDVTVSAAHDSDWHDEKADVDLRAPGFHPEIHPKWVKVKIEDDDHPPPPPSEKIPECLIVGGICPDPGVEIR